MKKRTQDRLFSADYTSVSERLSLKDAMAKSLAKVVAAGVEDNERWWSLDFGGAMGAPPNVSEDQWKRFEELCT